MRSGRFCFENFVLDPADRQLCRDDVPVELNARYFDALALLVREQGKLVSKDRFLEEVWRGIAVTDEALTQCIKTIRRQLGDNAASPRFIETVPKHGYRFIASVAWVLDEVRAAEGVTTALTTEETNFGTATFGAAGQTATHPSTHYIQVAGTPAFQTSIDGTPTSQKMNASGTPAKTSPTQLATYSWQQFFILGGTGT